MPAVTLKGEPIQLRGEPIQPGQDAPAFRLQMQDLSDYTLATSAGKTRILATVPSLDTPVCDLEMKRFNDEASKLQNVTVVCVSADLPFAQKRWCGDTKTEHIITASDHRDVSFGQSYGCLIEGGPLDRFLARAIFVIGPDDKVRYVEYVSEIAEPPNFEAALAAASS